MTDIDLDAITQRTEAATPGPWEADGREVSQHWSRPEPWQTVVGTEVSCMAYCYGGTARGVERDADAEFIAHAREDIPTLVAEVRRLTAALAEAEADALAQRSIATREAQERRDHQDRADRQAAALREAEAEIARLSGPHRCCPCCADDPVHDVEPNQHTIECTSCGYGAARAALREVGALAREYEARYDADSYDDTSPGLVAERLLSILARHSGGESDG